MNIVLEARTNDYSMSEAIGSSQTLTQPHAHGYEVNIDSLDRHDEIRIYTGRSEYRFLLTDPVSLLGLLAGGQLGEEPVEAQLLAVRDDDGFHLKDDFSIIGRGMRIIFHILADERTLATSPVTRLALVKHEG
ncbi:MAG: hypothetical protein L0229_23440 [Blastocatellia bacterium]|nr:hypothetical protein [Blastocatellia bacterium]